MHASEMQISLSILHSIQRFDEFKLIFRFAFGLVFSCGRAPCHTQIDNAGKAVIESTHYAVWSRGRSLVARYADFDIAR